MLKKYLFFLTVFFSVCIFAQEESVQFIKKNLVRADASIMAGYMFKDNLNNVHLNGGVEYYLDNRISVRGSASYMIGSSGLSADSMGLKDLASIYVGPLFHFKTKGHFDPYFIFQPGISYASSFKATYTSSPKENTKTASYEGAMSPIVTAGFGFNYYFQRYAHLFMEIRYVYGNHLSAAPHPISLQELRFTFGLGFNLFVHKEKIKPA